jgi:hypothetical protein
MKLAGSALASLMLLQPAPCDHPARGETKAVDLDAVARAYRDVAKKLTFEVERARIGDALAQPFESGLPACRGRTRRVERVEEVPAELVGTALHFGPRARDGAMHVVTEAKALKDVAGAVLASTELASRLGVRCAPSTVRVRAAKEVEIDEGD